MTSTTEIRDRFWKELKASPFLMIGLTGTSDHSQPMTAQFDDQNGPIWFYTTRDNRLAGGGEAMAQYAAKGHDFFACIHGRLTQVDDRATIDKYWSKPVEAWFPQGKDDPSLTMLRFDTDNAEMWLADMSYAGLFKMMFGGDVRREGEEKHAELAL